MSKHRAGGRRVDPHAGMQYGVRGRSPWLRLTAGFGALLALVGGVGYLISAQPGKAPGARLVEPSTGPTPQSTARTPATGSTPAASTATKSSTTTAAAGSAAAGDPLAAALGSPAGRPVRIRVPAIGVDSALQPLGLLPDGSLQAPSQPGRAGWYAGGAVPGAVGSAVIAGQADSPTAVFHRLPELRAGAQVLISCRSGRLLRFLVYDVHGYPKRGFPSAAVYGPVSAPVLRLIISTGGFDDQARDQPVSLVVSARLAGG